MCFCRSVCAFIHHYRCDIGRPGRPHTHILTMKRSTNGFQACDFPPAYTTSMHTCLCRPINMRFYRHICTSETGPLQLGTATIRCLTVDVVDIRNALNIRPFECECVDCDCDFIRPFGADGQTPRVQAIDNTAVGPGCWSFR